MLTCTLEAYRTVWMRYAICCIATHSDPYLSITNMDSLLMVTSPVDDYDYEIIFWLWMVAGLLFWLNVILWIIFHIL